MVYAVSARRVGYEVFQNFKAHRLVLGALESVQSVEDDLLAFRMRDRDYGRIVYETDVHRAAVLVVARAPCRLPPALGLVVHRAGDPGTHRLDPAAKPEPRVVGRVERAFLFGHRPAIQPWCGLRVGSRLEPVALTGSRQLTY